MRQWYSIFIIMFVAGGFFFAVGTNRVFAACTDPAIIFGVKKDCPETYLSKNMADAGKRAADIKALQSFLKSKGKNLGTTGPNHDGVDGDFGASTVQAVAEYQRGVGLPGDGAFGEDTAAAAAGGGASATAAAGGGASAVVASPAVNSEKVFCEPLSAANDKGEEVCKNLCFGIKKPDGSRKYWAVCYDNPALGAIGCNKKCWCATATFYDNTNKINRTLDSNCPEGMKPQVKKVEEAAPAPVGYGPLAFDITPSLKNSAGNNGYAVTDNPATWLAQVVGTVINGILSILGVILLLLIVYGGFRWLFAAGDETKVKQAHSLMIHSVIGLGIVLSAYAISVFITTVVLKSLR